METVYTSDRDSNNPSGVSVGNRLETVGPRRHYLSWPAVWGGLITAVAIMWLFSLLGSAIGMSVLDGSDAEALGNGFGIGTVLWLVITGLAAFFIGGLVTGRLCGQDDDQSGVLHGAVMWSTGTVLILILGYLGVSGLVNTGASVVGNATSAASTAVSKIPSAVQSANDAVPDQRANQVATGISATIKREIAAAVAADGDSAISQEEAEQAIEQLDADALQDIGMSYLQGNQQSAKDTLAVRTNLNEKQIDQLSNSISKAAEKRVNEYKAAASKAMATATDYAQAALYTSFVAASLGLIASILGAMWGCREAVRLHTVSVERFGVSRR